MSKSAILKSSIAKKWWMALTGLFLCLFLVGHLLGNLQLVFIDGVEGKRAFNEYAYFMTHNPLIKIMSYVTYLSILFHAIDGIMLTIQNKKARPVKYAYNKPGASSSTSSRYMAVLGSAILVFIVIHMANFWGKMHYTDMPLHTENVYVPRMTDPVSRTVEDTLVKAYYTTEGDFLPDNSVTVKDKTFLYEDTEQMLKQIAGIDPTYKSAGSNPVKAEGYKDLHSLTLAFFGHDKMDEAKIPANKNALIAVLLYVLAMAVLAFHLWHGFASAFQTLGLNNEKYTPLISGFGKAFSVLVPLAFAVIPVILFLTK